MNLLLHGVEAPRIDPDNSLRFRLAEIGEAERVDVILTNPPFGGEEERGILSNFPEDRQCGDRAPVPATHHAPTQARRTRPRRGGGPRRHAVRRRGVRPRHRALDDTGPSVVSVNGVVASLSVTEFMAAVTGIRVPYDHLEYRGDRGTVSRRRVQRADCYLCQQRQGKRRRSQHQTVLLMRKALGIGLKCHHACLPVVPARD